MEFNKLLTAVFVAIACSAAASNEGQAQVTASASSIPAPIPLEYSSTSPASSGLSINDLPPLPQELAEGKVRLPTQQSPDSRQLGGIRAIGDLPNPFEWGSKPPRR